jgi:hypothetical protein
MAWLAGPAGDAAAPLRRDRGGRARQGWPLGGPPCPLGVCACLLHRRVSVCPPVFQASNSRVKPSMSRRNEVEMRLGYMEVLTSKCEGSTVTAPPPLDATPGFRLASMVLQTQSSEHRCLSRGLPEPLESLKPLDVPPRALSLQRAPCGPAVNGRMGQALTTPAAQPGAYPLQEKGEVSRASVGRVGRLLRGGGQPAVTGFADRNNVSWTFLRRGPPAGASALREGARVRAHCRRWLCPCPCRRCRRLFMTWGEWRTPKQRSGTSSGSPAHTPSPLATSELADAAPQLPPSAAAPPSQRLSLTLCRTGRRVRHTGGSAAWRRRGARAGAAYLW